MQPSSVPGTTSSIEDDLPCSSTPSRRPKRKRSKLFDSSSRESQNIAEEALILERKKFEMQAAFLKDVTGLVTQAKELLMYQMLKVRLEIQEMLNRDPNLTMVTAQFAEENPNP
uniref:Uncharacterized protein n=1 Tax=Romanomermis culicivorax TaxID=13658 RepID=A0A915IBY1_ROMCU